MSKVYYVDSENVGDAWITILEESEHDSVFLIFYTAKSPHMSYMNAIKLISAAKKPEFILCHEGNNALDFQLVTHLGYMLCEKPDNEYVIVSKDTGFDSVIRFWTDRGRMVTRMSPSNIKAKAVTAMPVSSVTDAIIVPDVIQSGDVICGHSKAEIDDIIAAVPSENGSYLHLILTHFYGNRNGLDIYKQVTSKTYKPAERNLSSKERFVIICKYIEKYSEPKISVDDKLIDYLYFHRKNPGAIPNGLLKNYGNTNGANYKKVFKPFLKSLSKL